MPTWSDPVTRWNDRFVTWSGGIALPPAKVPTSSLAVTVGQAPPPEIMTAFNADRVIVYRYCDIYEDDNETIWRSNVGITDGSVSVSIDRAERRNIEITLATEDGNLPYGPDDGLWFDKIIKPFTGIVLPDGIWVTCLGEFLVDTTSRPHFPDTIALTGRDFTKKLMLYKLTAATSFTAGYDVGLIVRNLSALAGISKFNIPTGLATTTTVYAFERGTALWDVIIKIVEAYGLEVFFDAFGYLNVRVRVDPVTAPIAHEFTTGANGNIESYSRNTNDARLFNHQIVYADSNKFPFVVGEAENTDPDSPTRIARLGRRTNTYSNSMIETNLQAQTVASAFLSVSALEQYDVSLNSLVAPWLEGGVASRFLAPDAAPSDPDRYLLTGFTIPFALGSMPANVKRVHLVG